MLPRGGSIVFTFRCSACGKQHVVNRPFEEEFATDCLRCGEPIRVTAALIRPTTDAAGLHDSTHPELAEAITAGVSGRSAAADDGSSAADGEPSGADDLPPAKAETGDSRRRGRRKRRKALSDDEVDDSEAPDDVDPDEDARKRLRDSPDEAPADLGTRLKRNWPMVATGAAVVLALLGGGGYVLFGRADAGKKPAPKAEKAAPKKPAAAAPSTEKAPEPEKPVAKPREPEFRLAASRLAAELAAHPMEVNQKYKEKLLEVSGILDHLQAPAAAKTPVRPQALFACEGAAISCDLTETPTPLESWRRIRPGQPFTARGTYTGDGAIRLCELMPPTPPADVAYKGKAVELAGLVKAVLLPPECPFPTLRLEGDTDSLAELHCLFRHTDDEQVRRSSAGLAVIVRGTCGGRVIDLERGRPIVRLDNCQLVATTAPEPGVTRISPAQLLRAYEEDLRLVLVPPPGTEERVAEPFSVGQLSQAQVADPKALEKYRNKVVTLSGRVLQKPKGEQLLVLASDSTDQPLKVRCLFDRASYEDLPLGLQVRAELRVEGRCTVVGPGPVIQLDSCRDADAARRDPRQITADFLPHRPGQQLTYDVAEFPVPGRFDGPVRRAVLLQLENGITETLVTHAGNLVGKSLFDPAEGGKWIAQKKTVKAQLPGPTFLRRLSGGFLEVGQPFLTREGKKEVVWQPVLKLAARKGDSWTWAQGGATHDYSVEAFDERGGRSSVTVAERIINVADPNRRLERRHVYVRDVGEVEQHEWLLVTARQRVTVGEKRLIEAGEKAPAREEKPAAPLKPELKTERP
jgi:hypothetical protein